MKKCLLKLFFIVSITFSSLFAEDCVRSADPFLFYLKTGIGSDLKSDKGHLMLGLGGRYRKGHHGVDLSLSCYQWLRDRGLLHFERPSESVAVTGTYLYLPQPNAENVPYIGIGGGYVESFVHEYKYYGRTVTEHKKYLTADFIAGVEFRRLKTIKFLAQIEVKVPAISIQNLGNDRTPSICFSLGVGY